MIMNNFFEKYTKYFRDLNIDINNKALIKNKIINKEEHTYFQYKRVILYATFVLFFVFGSVFAVNYVENFNSLNVDIKNNKPYIDSTLQIDLKDNDSIKSYNCLSEKCDKTYKIKDLEEILNLKVLKDDKLANKEIVISSIEKNDNKISKLSFLINDIEYDDFKLQRFSFMTKTKHYITNENELPFSNQYKTIYIDKIDTNILISEDSYQSVRVCFDYENFSYNLLIHFNLNISNKESIIEKYITSLI